MQHQGIEYADATFFGAPPPSNQEPGDSYAPYFVQLPKEYFGFDFRLLHPRPGLSLFLCDCTAPQDIVNPYTVGQGAVCFSTVLSGCMDTESRWDMPGVCGPEDRASLCDNCTGKTLIQANVQQRSVSVILQMDFLQELIRGNNQFDKSLLEAANKRNGMYLLDHRPPSPQTQVLATQLLDCRLTGVCRDLFIESKSLELLFVFLHRMSRHKPDPTVSLSRGDVERLHEARRVLLDDLTEPPSIRELAKQVGLNEFKLKNGFREVFGSTVYGALRTERLNAANTLLHDSDTSVSDVATAVGYTNMGHFIALFRGQFGVTPGHLLRQSRRDGVHCS